MVRDDTARALRNRLRVAQSRSRVPSIAAGLSRSGRLIWFGGVGEVGGSAPGDETQYRCGSISKTFVAVEVMRLRDEGLVDLSDPIGRHIAELEHLGCTIGQLLSHTSGLRAETAGPWWERTPGMGFAALVASSLRPEDVLQRPGRRFHYSNVGYAVLGELISRIRKRSFEDVIDEDILRELGMLRTDSRPARPFAPGLGVHPHADVVLHEPAHDSGAMGPAGQLWTTVDDLARWSSVLAGQRPEILSPASAAEMREPVAVSDMPEQPWTSAYGLGIQILNEGGRRRYGHNGSMPGFLALLRIDARTNDALVVLTNATSGLETSLEADLFSILDEHEPAPPEEFVPLPGGVAPEVLEILGVWYWGTTAFVLSMQHDRTLSLDALSVGREATFAPAGTDTYLGLSGYYAGETMSVVRRADSSLSHLDIGSFVLTRLPYDPSAPIPGGVDESGWVGGPQPREPRHPFRSHGSR